MKKRRIALATVPLIAACAWLWSYHASSDPAAQPASSPPARTILVAPGHVETVREPVELAFNAQGRIMSVDVEEGDAVSAGEVLARLDDRLARAHLAAAEAAFAQATARFELTRRGPRREELRAARADAQAAAATAANRRAERARSNKLAKTGAVPLSAVEADRTAARVASSLASAARARYLSLAKGARRETIEEAMATLELARAEIEAAKVALDQTILRAPSDGVILRRNAEIGMLVTIPAPEPVVIMADLRELEVRAEVDEADVAAIAVGQAAWATADAYGERKFPVRIARITYELGRKTVRDDDPRARVDSRVLEVIARFEGAPPTLPIGLRMSVHIELVRTFDELHREPSARPMLELTERRSPTITVGETR